MKSNQLKTFTFIIFNLFVALLFFLLGMICAYIFS